MNGGVVSTENPDCYYGDHDYHGGACAGCGKRLRCACGAFALNDDDWWDAHLLHCRFIERVTRASTETGGTPE